MISKLGDKNFTILAKMLDMAASRQKVISANIANINTPNYKRQEFNFQASLREALREGTAEAFDKVDGYIDKPNNTLVRNNGNNVDADLEMTHMHENSMAYDVYAQIYNRANSLTMAAIKS